MKRWIVVAVVVLGLAAGAGIEMTKLAASQEKEPVWRTDYDKARAEARQSGKPLLVVFRCER
jgi:hypothetical protein